MTDSVQLEADHIAAAARRGGYPTRLAAATPVRPREVSGDVFSGSASHISMIGTRIAFSRATRPVGIVIVLLAGAIACGGDCAGVGSPAFSIDVVDAVTGRAAATGATVYVFRRPDLSLVDAVASEDTLRILAAWDQSGRFDVLLEKAGYWPWTENNVLVETHASCTTKTVHLIARLRLRSI